MSKLTRMALAAFMACALGAYAQTTTNATRNGSHVLQGNFEDGITPDTGLLTNGNSKRCGAGGSGGNRRINVAVWQLALPNIPAGETLTAATFSFQMAAAHVNGAPLYFDMMVSLMNATDVSEITAADFIETNAPVDSALGNGIVIDQIGEADVSSGATIEVDLTGAALAQLAALYDAGGVPSQSDIWFRLSPSVPIVWTNSADANDRFQFEDDGSGSAAVFDLELNWGVPPTDIYYVATNPTPWDVGAAWSDGLPAHSGADYFVTNGVALQTPSTTATFPGNSLNLDGSQTVELMVSGADVITFSPLDLVGDTLRAGAVSTNEARVDGTINVAGNPTFAGATDNTRNLRVLAQIDGVSTVSLTAPAQTIYIDNAANTFAGTWNLTGNYAEFTSPGAVGTGSIQVGNFGKLRILGDWDGLATGETLTVADSSNAVVDVGTYAWTVSALSFGTNDVAAGATYTAAELNAIGSNTVFSGSGTIQVGPLPLPAPGEMLLGIDDWQSAGAPGVNVYNSNLVVSASASAVGGTQNWTINDSSTDPGRGSSKDGTWGTYDGGTNSPNTVTNAHGSNFALTNGKTDGEVTMTISNAGPTAVVLGQIHFDAVAFRPNAARTYAVNVLTNSIGITPGNVFTSEDDAITSLGGNLNPTNNLAINYDQHDDIDIGLFGIADHTLEPGEVAVIQLEFTSGTGSGGGHHLFLDNLGISAFGETAPEYVSPVITGISSSGGNVFISGTSGNGNAGAEYRLQSKAALTSPSWSPVATNTFDGSGNFSISHPAGGDEEFYRLEVGP